eukprot:scaffold220811_cov33-Tisochrysis_lutea.AAC.4
MAGYCADTVRFVVRKPFNAHVALLQLGTILGAPPPRQTAHYPALRQSTLVRYLGALEVLGLLIAG